MTAVAHQVTPFLTSYEVMARYHISYTTLWRRIKDGSLPQPRINRNTRNSCGTFKIWRSMRRKRTEPLSFILLSETPVEWKACRLNDGF